MLLSGRVVNPKSNIPDPDPTIPFITDPTAKTGQIFKNTNLIFHKRDGARHNTSNEIYM
jgi:hypothetical protein